MATYVLHSGIYSSLGNDQCVTLDNDGQFYKATPPFHTSDFRDAGNARQEIGPQTVTNKYSKIQDGLEMSISIESRSRISEILTKTQQLSDVEKFLLYLKLPTGVPYDESLRQTPPSCIHSSNRAEQAQAFTWIRSHLEVHGDVCMAKQEVYDDYKAFCDKHQIKPLCNADFGKMMKQVFPDLKCRRLGQRGQSRYFYGGLHRKLEFDPPTLPEFEIQTTKIEEEVKDQSDEIYKASCQVVCEWAQKLLEVGFTGLRELAEHLVTNVYVNSKSFAACTVIAALQDTDNQNVKNSALFTSQPSSGGDKHRETTIQLQRKIHENKIMKEQRKKIQQMKEAEHARTSSSLERKTPVTPNRKSVTPSQSVTPSRTCKTPKLPSPSESPLPLESPQKFGNFNVTPRLGNHFQPMAVRKLDNVTSVPSDVAKYDTGVVSETKPVTREVNVFIEGRNQVDEKMNVNDGDQTPNLVGVTISSAKTEIHIEKGKRLTEDNGRYEEMETEETKSPIELGSNGISQIYQAGDIAMNQSIVAEVERQIVDQRNKESGSESDSKSNDTEVEVISDEDISDTSMKTITEVDSSHENEVKTETMEKIANDTQSLSKSTGYLSLKTLLGKVKGAESLNKSVGFLNSEKAHNLFANKAEIQTRSAFVPFSHVQSRKDAAKVCQSMTTLAGVNTKSVNSYNNSSAFTLTTVPQNSHVTMVALPQTFPANSESNQCGSDLTRLPDNVITIIPTSNVSAPGNPPGSITLGTNFQTSISATTVGDVCVKSAASIITTTKTLTAVSTSDAGITWLQSSPVTPTQVKTRFTPIRPKASPVKNPPAIIKDSKSDNPSYDKRPVSTILKEKRAREQAEAIAKFQASLKLQTVPNMQFAQNITFPNQGTVPAQVPSVASVTRELFTLPVQNAPPGKDVVIIMNSKAGGTGHIHTILTSPSTSFIQNPFFGANIVKQKKLMESSVQLKDTSEDVIYEEKETEINSETNNTIADKHTPQQLEFMESESSQEVELVSKEDDEISEQMDVVFSETPVKIAKLNITSPFAYRSESVCSLGRETPIKVVKISESSQNRPESACSYGRETPSGARKRKSTELSQKQCFKRLNSTGEVEDMDDISLDDSSLNSFITLEDPQKQSHPRRTQSCTFELDTDSKPRTFYPKSQQIVQLASLQSPDISSLEREALIESFPHSVGSIGPRFPISQQSSVGVNVKALRNSQQKLIKEQQYLNHRCDKFLQKGVSGDSVVSDCLTDSDRVQLAEKTGLDMTEQYDPGQGTKKLCSRGKIVTKYDQCMSELPSEVADFINESIEKSEHPNESVSSDSEQDLTNSSEKTPSVILPNLNIDLEKELIPSKEIKTHFGLTVLQAGATSTSKQDTELFTVPKVPPANVRVREGIQRSGSSESQLGQTIQQRCSSLPSFTSPVRSIMSPVNRPSPYQRASSMSPRSAQNLEREISPVSKIISPIQRVDIRDNHPISVNIHSNTKLRDAGNYYRPNTLPLRGNAGDDIRSPQATPYLASLQHNLQKPGEIVSEQTYMKPRETVSEKIGTTLASSVQYGRGSETVVDKTEILPTFSDSGYQSIGASPVTNSTPVSNAMEMDSVLSQQSKLLISYSPRNDAGDLSNPSPIMHVTPNMNIGAPMTMPSPRFEFANKFKANILTASNSSAFIPIQGSPNDMQYVRPIRPMVTIANNNAAPPSDVFMSPTMENIPSDVLVISPKSQDPPSYEIISPKSQDPPSYEIAVKSLRQQNREDSQTGKDGNINPPQNQTELNVPQMTNMFVNVNTVQKDVGIGQAKDLSEKGSLLADMGKTNGPNNWSVQTVLGPYASKLAQLSRQTKQTSIANPANANSKVMSVLSERQINNVVSNADQGFVSQKPSMSNLQSANQHTLPYIPSKHVQDLNLVLGAEAHLNIHETIDQSQSPNLNIHMNAEHINQSPSLTSNLNVIHEGADLNLNAESESFLPRKYSTPEQFYQEHISIYPSSHSNPRVNVNHPSTSPRNPSLHEQMIYNHPENVGVNERIIFSHPSNTNASMNEQTIFNSRSNTMSEIPDARYIGNPNVNIQEMFSPASIALSQAIEKELKSGDSELNVDELNKTWEAIKEMEGISGKDMFSISSEDVQRVEEIENFKMFEDC